MFENTIKYVKSKHTGMGVLTTCTVFSHRRFGLELQNGSVA